MAPPPLVIASDTVCAEIAIAEIEGAGWQVATQARPGQVQLMSVTDEASAASAVMGALGGVGLVVITDGPRELVDDLAEDLARIGRVHQRGPGAPDLDAGTWALLHALARGLTVASAARSGHMAVRTAERRIALAQRELGAPTRAALLRTVAGRERIAPPELAG